MQTPFTALFVFHQVGRTGFASVCLLWIAFAHQDWVDERAPSHSGPGPPANEHPVSCLPRQSRVHRLRACPAAVSARALCPLGIWILAASGKALLLIPRPPGIAYLTDNQETRLSLIYTVRSFRPARPLSATAAKQPGSQGSPEMLFNNPMPHRRQRKTSERATRMTIQCASTTRRSSRDNLRHTARLHPNTSKRSLLQPRPHQCQNQQNQRA